MYQPKFIISNSITQNLTQIERFRGFLEAANLSETWLAIMQKKALILEAYYTTHIEGTHLSLDQAKQILDDQTIIDVDIDFGENIALKCSLEISENIINYPTVILQYSYRL